MAQLVSGLATFGLPPVQCRRQLSSSTRRKPDRARPVRVVEVVHVDPVGRRRAVLDEALHVAPQRAADPSRARR
jgi:hypothetical protein